MTREGYQKIREIITEAGPGKITEVTEKLLTSGAIKIEDLEEGNYYLGVGSHGFVGKWIPKRKAFIQLIPDESAEIPTYIAMPVNYFTEFDGTGYFVPIEKVCPK